MTMPEHVRLELSGLLWSLGDGSFSPADVARIEELAVEYPEVHALYAQYMVICGMLQWERASHPSVSFGESMTVVGQVANLSQTGSKLGRLATCPTQNPTANDSPVLALPADCLGQPGAVELPNQPAAVPPSPFPLPPFASPLPVPPTIIGVSAPMVPSGLGFFGGVYHGTVAFFSQEVPFSILVATLIFGLGGLIGSLMTVEHYAQLATNGPRQPVSASVPGEWHPAPERREPETVMVGQITGMVDCTWIDNHFAPAHNRVALGAKYMLASGLMEITYKTGARVILQGPCTYEVESPAGGYLSLGKLMARVEKKRGRGGEGEKGRPADLAALSPSLPLSPSPPLFSVRTPTAIVTDLGTEFGVEVNNAGETRSHVFCGKVVLAALAADGEEQGRKVVLEANQSARVEKSEKKDGPSRVIVARKDAVKPEEYVRVEQMAVKVKEVRERPLKAFRQWQTFSEQLRRRDDLLAYYDFQRDADNPRDENGAELLRNRAKTGRQFDGHVWGSLRLGMAKGRFHGKEALKFANPGDGVRINIPTECRQMTLAAWIYLERPPETYASLLMTDKTAPAMCHWQLIPDGTMSLTVVGRQYEYYSLPVLDNACKSPWRFVAAACDCDAGEVAFYLDGKPAGSRPLAKDTAAVRIGSATIGAWESGEHWQSSPNPMRVFDGRMDELMIFHAVLSAEEIKTLAARHDNLPDARGAK